MASALPRRTLLAGGAAAAAAGVAACGTPTPSAPPAAPAAPAAPATIPPAAGPAPTASTGPAIRPAADVPVGGAVIVPELELVISQPTAGTFTGLSAICTHTGCIVDRVDGGSIICPCHGSRYGLDGSVQQGPAPRPLDPRPVSVVNGEIVLQ
jgi:Rieske Fe-S protein